MATDPTPTMPELRLSPDGKRIAHKAFANSPWPWSWRTLNGPLFFGAATQDDVADWTPLVPAPATVDRDEVVLTGEGVAVAQWLQENTFNAYEEQPDWVTARRRAAELLAYVRENAEPAAPAVPAADDPVQRVANALQCAAFDAEMYLRVDCWSDKDWHVVARAAIAALREVPHVGA